MRKFLLSVVLFVTMSGSVLADDIKLHIGGQDKTPDGIQTVNTQSGAVFYAGQGLRRVEVGPNVQVNVLVEEDFSKFTAGSEEAPDAIDIMSLENSDSYFLTPGWSGTEVHQAGGKAFFEMGVDEKGGDNPGYLMTPDIDLSKGQGVYRATFRVKNVNKNSLDAPMQYFILNNSPENKGVILADGLAMSTEDYTDLEVIGTGGVQYTSVMFLSWRGKMMVDNVKIEELIFPLAIPQNVKAELLSANTIKATWDAVEGAKSYTVTLMQEDKEIVTVDSDTNEAELVGNFVPGVAVSVYVTARNGDDNSYPARLVTTLMPQEVETPLALEATNVTENGFTANWENSPFAANYQLYVNYSHEVTEEGENMTYLYEDFQEVPFDSSDDERSTIMTKDGSPVLLDDYINYPGWSVFLCSLFKGVLAITNMYEIYGFPGVLMGPAADYSLGGGKVNVQGVCMSLVDDAVMKIGFGTLGFDMSAGKMVINFEEGAKEVDVSTKGTMFDVQLEGGGPDKQIVFQMTDGAQSGDMIAFLGLNIYTELAIGDMYNSLYKTVSLPGDVTSYDVEGSLKGNDSYQYYVVGSFGDMKSGQSNVITVSAPSAIKMVANTGNHVRITDNGILIDNPTGADVTVLTADGRQMAPMSRNASVYVPVAHGTYIVRVGNDSFKVLR